MMKAFGGDVTTPGVVIEVLSSDQVEPFRDDGPEAAAALPAAAKNKTSAQQQAYLRFLSSLKFLLM